MKKLINAPSDVVREMLQGHVAMTPGVALLRHENVVVRNPMPAPDSRAVAVISGGGAGHEPAHAGYVGEGMLTAAVVGEVFTSPSVDAIVAGIRAVAGPAGALLVVKNYTGDRLNFGLAAELAAMEGIPTEIVVVADDIALAGLVAAERRRGIAGTVLVHKVAGAAAAAGLPLAEAAELARAAAADLGTMGVSLGSCTVPAVGRPGFELADDEVELGLGIHGEKGIERVKLQPADALADRLLDHILAELALQKGDTVALLVNGLGATPPMELPIVMRHALQSLAARGIRVERAWAGSFLTAIDMPGCSISLMKLSPERRALLDAPARAPAWPGNGSVPAGLVLVDLAPVAEEVIRGHSRQFAPAKTQSVALAVANALEQAEPYLTDLDSKAGDGDLGASMQRGAQAIRALPETSWSDPATAMIEIGTALRRSIAGSSGPFYAIALTRAGRFLAEKQNIRPEDFQQAFQIAVAAVAEIGGAKPGDRTMIDALEPALQALSGPSGAAPAEAWAKAAMAAEQGAEATTTMTPRLGRASYLGARAIGVPDGGAAAVSIWLKALVSAL